MIWRSPSSWRRLFSDEVRISCEWPRRRRPPTRRAPARPEDGQLREQGLRTPRRAGRSSNRRPPGASAGGRLRPRGPATASSSRRGSSVSIVPAVSSPTRAAASSIRERQPIEQEAELRDLRDGSKLVWTARALATKRRPPHLDERRTPKTCARRGERGDDWSRAVEAPSRRQQLAHLGGGGIDLLEVVDDQQQRPVPDVVGHRVGGPSARHSARRAQRDLRHHERPRHAHRPGDEIDPVSEVGRELVSRLGSRSGLPVPARAGERDEGGLRSRAATSSTSRRRPTRAVAGAGRRRRALAPTARRTAQRRGGGIASSSSFSSGPGWSPSFPRSTSSGVLERCERIGLTARPVQRDHELTTQALPQGMSATSPSSSGVSSVRRPSAEVGLDPLLDRRSAAPRGARPRLRKSS